MGDAYPITPIQVEPIQTNHRVIRTPIPHPHSVPMLEQLRRAEAACMEGQPPIVWDHAEGATVYDPYGNKWIDFTSGVLITNAGHGRKEMIEAIVRQAERGLLTSYCFPNTARAELVALLQKLSPRPTDKVMLLSTGSEAVELCIKHCRAKALGKGIKDAVMVTFTQGFHGRTMGSQLAGGIPSLKDWIGYPDEHFINVPYPDGGIRSRPEDNDFAAFERSLREQEVDESRVCGVMMETYLGGNAAFAVPEYVRALRKWCDERDAVLVMDEVQAGFGRTGRFWGFEHYGITPDLIACGKGISSSLPLSAVIGRRELLDQFPPGSATSTHSGNPICCAAALANLKLIVGENLAERAAKLEPVLLDGCRRIHERFRDVVHAYSGKGLVASVHCKKRGGIEPDAKLAWEVVGRCVQTGLMLFGPVGYGSASVKLSPPLVIEESALVEAMQVLEEAFAFVLDKRTKR